MPAIALVHPSAAQPAAQATTHADLGRDQAVLARLIASLGDAAFADEALAALNEPLQAASWSVYRLWRDRAPELHLSASRGVADTTASCFAAYHDGLYRLDRSFDLVRGGATLARRPPGQATVLHMRAADAPTAEHRERIYRRHGLAERLSVAASEADGSLLAVNLYHHEHQGAFSGREREGFVRIAALLLASVRRHLALTAPGTTGLARAAGGAAGAGPDDGPSTCAGTGAGTGGRALAGVCPSPRELLRAACPALTPRELDVCERLLRGWSHDGVAADLGLSTATVKTYRTRAFGRLGLHFRSELFARFGPAGAAALDD